MKAVFEDEQVNTFILKCVLFSPFSINCPQVRHNGLQRTVQHSTRGEVGVVGPAVRFSHSLNDIRGPPPTLGQHTDSVLQVGHQVMSPDNEESLLQGLGYSDDDILHLRKESIVA